MQTPRQVPWTGSQEWKYVNHALHSEEKNERRAGVARVKTWRSRGKLPHAVDCTAVFVEILLRDEDTANLLSLHELRLMYTTAFIRFFNGLVDPAQRGAFAVSVATIAERLRLPKWFVELRHAGTHEHLPSLLTLRTGCRQALDWLSENYWAASARVETAVEERHEPTKLKVRSSLQDYKTIRKSDLKDPKMTNGEIGGSRSLNHTISQIIAMASRRDVVRELLPEILMDVGYLVPTGKKKRVRTSDLTLPKELSDLWSPLLKTLDRAWPDFASDLVAVIVDQLHMPSTLPSLTLNLATGFAELEDPSLNEKSQYLSTSYLATLAAWLRHIALPLLGDEREVEICMKGTDIDDILEKCLRRPNLYTQAILSFIASRDSTVGPLLKPLLPYIQLSNDQTVAGGPKIDNKTPAEDYSDAALETEFHLIQARNDSLWKDPENPEVTSNQLDIVDVDMEEDTSTDPLDSDAATNGWKLVASDTWKICPIGCLPDYPNGDSMPLDLTVH